MITRAVYLSSVVMLFAFSAWPCGSSGPYEPFFLQDGNVYELPHTSFGSEITRILQEYYKFDPVQEEQKRNPYKATIAADIQDLKESMADVSDSEEIIKNYRLLRLYLPYQLTQDSHDGIVNKIPEEFSLYIRGAVAFHTKQWEKARELFEAILELPSDQRSYKSVWAAFMLGKTFLEMKKPEEALPFFEQTRTFIAEGYRDTLELTADSWAWQGRTHYLLKEYLPELKSYIEQYKASQGHQLSVASISGAIMNIRDHQEIMDEIIKDKLLRTLFTAWLGPGGYMEHSKVKRWLEMNKKLNDENAISDADLLARIAYTIGDMNAAQYWVEHSASDSPHAQVVKAKLLMREGLVEEGIEILESLVEIPQNTTEGLSTEYFPYGNNSRALLPHLASALMKQERYAEALKAFLAAGNQRDSILLAERIMTIPELQEFVERYQHDQNLTNPATTYPRRSSISNIKHLLAKRLARVNRWKDASPLYPEQRTYYPVEHIPYNSPSLTERALIIAEHLEQIKNTNLSNRQQALHYFEAAKVIYDDGPNLLGIEKSFDGRYHFFPYGNLADRTKRNLTEISMKRFDTTEVPPAIYSHYRYLAADLMKQCADLLPNNDPLAAEALYLGGTYLKKYDPEAADPFYKALVRRNPNLLIARHADELRWFPKEFTDVVLYTPRVKPLLPRKRTLAFWLAGSTMTICAGVLLVALVKKKGKRTRTIVEDDVQPLK